MDMEKSLQKYRDSLSARAAAIVLEIMAGTSTKERCLEYDEIVQSIRSADRWLRSIRLGLVRVAHRLSHEPRLGRTKPQPAPTVAPPQPHRPVRKSPTRQIAHKSRPTETVHCHCSLAGAAPPWQWSWGELKPFSEMWDTGTDDDSVPAGLPVRPNRRQYRKDFGSGWR
jgi:hypothetical protein